MNHFGYESEKFYIEWSPCNYIPKNFRDAWEYRAREIYKDFNKIILGVSSGLDSQIALYSFLNQKIPIKTAFFYMRGYNDSELLNLKILENKFNFLTDYIIEIDPLECKDDIINESIANGNVPYDTFLKKKFIQSLPDDYAFVYGSNGPNLFVRNNSWYVIDCPGDFAILLANAFRPGERKSPIVIWEHSSEIMYGFLKESYVISLMNTFSYQREIDKNLGNEKLPFYGYWDVYVKPFVYAKYWEDKLIYFPKNMGVEKIDYIMTGPNFNYYNNLVIMKYNELISLFEDFGSERKRFYARD
jgi:hypothetical protein